MIAAHSLPDLGMGPLLLNGRKPAGNGHFCLRLRLQIEKILKECKKLEITFSEGIRYIFCEAYCVIMFNNGTFYRKTEKSRSIFRSFAGFSINQKKDVPF